MTEQGQTYSTRIEIGSSQIDQNNKISQKGKKQQAAEAISKRVSVSYERRGGVWLHYGLSGGVCRADGNLRIGRGEERQTPNHTESSVLIRAKRS